ncbi:MAG: molybdopterin-guanine dinucleotide biosynthesis protein B, partial [Candidatus Bathyarchaeia archaeon]
MSAPRAVAVVGYKDAGKTRVVEALVRELTRRGLRVGTLKHASRTHLLDTPGKDTWRHREAGSVASAILTPESAAVFINRPLRVAEAVEGLGPIDIVVLEGFKSLDAVPRILIPRDAEEVEALANGLEI